MPARTAPSSDNVLLGKGQLFFDRFDANGVSTGLVHMGNVESFELTTEDDIVTKKSSMVATSPTYIEVNRGRTVTLKITGDEFNPANMALLQMGDVSTLVQAATAVVAEPVAATTIPGAYYTTKKLGPISAVTVTFGATPGVLNTDYAIIDALVGLWRILPGTVQTGAVTIGYTPTAYTSTTGPAIVSGGTAGIIQGRFKFIGYPTTGPRMMVDVWKVNIKPDGALGLISEDFATFGLTGTALDDSANNPSFPTHKTQYLP